MAFRCMMSMVVSSSLSIDRQREVSYWLTFFADHFSMMCPPFSDAVGGIVVDAVARATAEE